MDPLAKSIMFHQQHHKIKNSAMAVSSGKGFAIRDTDICQLWQEPKNNLHVIKCNSKNANDKWAESIEALGE